MASLPLDGPVVRILIADDHRLFAESLMAVLSQDDRVDIVGIADNGEEAVNLALDLRPDVILMDIHMPVFDGLEATRRLRQAGSTARILIVTGGVGELGSEDAIRAGASGYLRKESSVGELKDLLLGVASLAAVLGHVQIRP